MERGRGHEILMTGKWKRGTGKEEVSKEGDGSEEEGQIRTKQYENTIMKPITLHANFKS